MPARDVRPPSTREVPAVLAEAEGAEGQALAAAVQYAVRAPSGHNSQPWVFQVVGDRLRLYRDRTRALPVVDPDDRELTISCGAALGHLRVALRESGYGGDVRVLPDESEPDLVADVGAGRRLAPGPHEHELFGAIGERRTNRHAFEDRQVPSTVQAELQRDAEAEGARLVLVDGPERRERIAELIGEGDLVQFADKGFRRELSSWIHWNHSRRRDGMPGHAHGVGDARSLVGSLVIRSLNLGGAQATTDRRLVTDAPVLAVLTTPTDDPSGWVAAGQALSTLLLRATARGLSASFLNQPVEIATLRPKVAEALGAASCPQLILRLGYGTPDRGTPRRSVADVLRR